MKDWLLARNFSLNFLPIVQMDFGLRARISKCSVSVWKQEFLMASS